jgi:2-polyprenyl-3-methyl-5-hydroxy-6-metoxy-1,4-benzoquinol methylase
VQQVSDSRSLYAGYEEWKGWNRPFTFTDDDGRYFAGEMRGIDVAGKRVLEIGFGSGSFLAWARTKGAEVAGIEIIETLLEAARREDVELIDPAIEDAAGNHSERFDLIVAFDVFEHFPLDVVAARLSAARTMLKPGGHLVLRFPNAQSPFGLPPQNGDPTHRSALSRSVFEQLCQTIPFEFVRYAPSYRTPGKGIAKRLVRGLRGAMRDGISRLLNFVYASNIPWDSVVVLVLRKPV